MANLTLVANIKAKEDRIEFVKGELLKLMEPTRAETGCIKYELHMDNKNPANFIMYEIWESYDIWQDHMNTEHLKGFAKVAENDLASFEVTEMSKIA